MTTPSSTQPARCDSRVDNLVMQREDPCLAGAGQALSAAGSNDACLGLSLKRQGL